MNLNNPFADMPVTNPSPFKLFKSQTPSLSSISNPPPQAYVPNSSAFYSNFSTTNNPPVLSNSFNQQPMFFSNSGTSNQASLPKPSLNPSKDSIFAGNKDLETKKNQLLNKKRIQDLLADWKEEFNKSLLQFHSLAEQVSNSEKSLKETQKEVVLLQEYRLKIDAEHKKMEETIEMILTEQTDLNGALDVIDKELDKVLQNTGLYIGTEEKENIYKTCNSLSKNIDTAENLCLNALKQIENKDSEDNQDVVHTIDVFLETLDWIEKTVENINEKMIFIEKEYKYLL